MILHVKSRRGNGTYMWRKIKDVEKAQQTKHGCLIIRRKGEETKHYHSKEYKEFYTEGE